MKKLLVVVLVVLAAVFLLAPRLVGGKAQERYEQMVEQLRAGGAQVTGVSYDRGWFGAQANTELVIPLPPAAREIPQLPEELHFSLASTLQHGPLTAMGGLGLAEIKTQILLDGKQLFPADYPAKLHTRVALNGSSRTAIDLPAIKIPAAGDQPEIDFRGLSGILNISAGFDQVDSRIESPGASLAGDPFEQLDIGEFTLDTQTARGAAGLMLGDIKMAVSHLRMAAGGLPGAVNIDQLYAEGSSSAEGELVSGTVRYRIGSLKVGQQEYKEGEIQLSAGNLAAPVLAQIQKGLDEIQMQRIDPQMQGAAIMSTLITQLPLLLQHDPVLAIDSLRIDTPEGRVEGRFKVQSRDLRWDDLQGSMAFLQKLEADAQLKLPETLFRQLSRLSTERDINREIQLRRDLGEEVAVPPDAELNRMIDNVIEQQIAALLGQKLIVRDGGRLVSTANFQQGRLTVNGERMELPFLPPAQ